MTVKSMSGTKTYTNNGRGYPVNDRIMFQQAQSCLIETDDGAGNWPLTVVAAVRHLLRYARTARPHPLCRILQVRNGEPGPVALDLSVRKARMGTLVPALVPTAVTMQKAGAAPGGAPYTLYRAPYKLPISSWSTTFDVSLGTGKARIADAFKTTGVIAGADCVSSFHVAAISVKVVLTQCSGVAGIAWVKSSPMRGLDSIHGLRPTASYLYQPHMNEPSLKDNEIRHHVLTLFGGS